MDFLKDKDVQHAVRIEDVLWRSRSLPRYREWRCGTVDGELSRLNPHRRMPLALVKVGWLDRLWNTTQIYPKLAFHWWRLERSSIVGVWAAMLSFRPVAPTARFVKHKLIRLSRIELSPLLPHFHQNANRTGDCVRITQPVYYCGSVVCPRLERLHVFENWMGVCWLAVSNEFNRMNSSN